MHKTVFAPAVPGDPREGRSKGEIADCPAGDQVNPVDHIGFDVLTWGLLLGVVFSKLPSPLR